MNVDLHCMYTIIITFSPTQIDCMMLLLEECQNLESRSEERFCFAAVLSATGNIKANAPTLFIIPEQIVATPLKLAI